MSNERIDFTNEKIRIPMYTKEVSEQWDEIVTNLKKGDEVFGRTVIGVCVCNQIMLDETLDRTYKGICSGHTACQWCDNCGPKLDEDFDFEATSETGIGTCKECSAEIKASE